MNFRRAWITSLLLHILLLALLYFGVPSFVDEEIIETPRVITAEILPMSEISNVKPKQKEQPPAQEKEKPKVVEEVKKPAPPVKQEKAEVTKVEPVPEKPKEEPKSEEPVKKEEVKKEEPKPKPKPKEEALEIKKEEPKKEEPKKEEPKKEEAKKKTEKASKEIDDIIKADNKKPDKKSKKVADDLDSLLKNIDTASGGPKPNKGAEKAEHSAESESYDSSIPISQSERDFIKGQISKCWNVPAGAKDAENLKITVKIEYSRDGKPVSVKLVDNGRSSEPYYRAAADSAMRAVKLCSPLKGLPENKFGGWKDMEITFDPKDML